MKNHGYSSGLNKASDLARSEAAGKTNMAGKGQEDYADMYLLVQKIKAGDREAFTDITRLYQKKVYLLAYSFFHNQDDAMDIVQETFLRLYQKAGLYQQGRNFQSWLLQIAKNLCIDYYRKQYKKEADLSREKSVEDLNVADNEAQNDIYAGDLKDIFTRCLDKLSERQRMIFVMKHYNQLKYEEIAQALDIAVGTVKSLNFKAIQNLKILMSPYVGEKV